MGGRVLLRIFGRYRPLPYAEFGMGRGLAAFPHQIQKADLPVGLAC